MTDYQSIVDHMGALSCVVSVERMAADSKDMSNISGELASAVLQTTIKLR